MVKAPSPLLGFNNNVRHRGRVFHIQTEDSGIRHPHIITHLFADGGRILKTTKTSYAEHVGRPGFAETVRGMMQEQHKAMFIALRDGQYDYLFDESAHPPAGSGPSAASAPAAAASPPGAAAANASAAGQTASAPAASPPQASAPAPAPAPPAAHAAPAPPAASASVAPAAPATASPMSPPGSPKASSPPLVSPSAPPSNPSVLDLARRGPPSSTGPGPFEPPVRRTDTQELVALGRPTSASEPAPLGADEARARAGVRPKMSVSTDAIHAPPPPLPPKRAPYESAIDLDLDALERAAAEAQTPFFQQINDLPPPPAAVLGKKPGGAPMSGSYSAVNVGTPVTDTSGAPRPPIQPIPARSASTAPTGTGRYAPPRPASIFATTRPPEGASIFGEDLISEKSLDEVILSYLAEDLETAPDKK